MTLEIEGKLIVKSETQHVSDKFAKRELVLELTETINGNLYTNYARMQLVQNKCDMLDRFNLGDVLKASFNVKGRKWDKDGKTSYFTELDVWRLDLAGAAPLAPSNDKAASAADDLPF